MKTTSVKFQLNVWFVVIISFLLIVFGSLNYIRMKSELKDSISSQIDSTLVRLSYGLPIALWNFDKNQIQQSMSSEMFAAFVVGISVQKDGKLVAGLVKGDDGKEMQLLQVPSSDLVKEAKLEYVDNGQSKSVGVVSVYVSYAEIDRALNIELIRTVVEILVLDVIIIFALSKILSAIVLKPLAGIGQALRNISEGEADLTMRISRAKTDEFNDVADGFNRFVNRLQTILLQVKDNISTIAHASHDIARGNIDLSSRTESQASSIEETSAAMEEITGTVKQNAENAQAANRMADTAAHAVAKGERVVQQVVLTMGAINQSSRKISDIISVIDGIAFQTNILALNAAVEAARAGEQGRGFAVVASEVRSLSGRSATAAKQIKALIDESVASVQEGTKLVDEAGATMGEILLSMQKVTTVMAEIQLATREQTLGIQQVNEAVRLMDSDTQKNAALVDEAAAAASSMQSQSASLAEVVSVFKLETALRLQAY